MSHDVCLFQQLQKKLSEKIGNELVSLLVGQNIMEAGISHMQVQSHMLVGVFVFEAKPIVCSTGDC